MKVAGRRALRLIVGALVALAAVFAFAGNVEWSLVFAAVGSARPMWTVAAIASVLLTLSLVTLRWGRLLDREPSSAPTVGIACGRARSRVLWDAVVLGQAVNILVPLRFGEGVRLAVTSRGLHVPAGRVMVGLALERLLDVAAFATIVAMLVVGGWMPRAFPRLLPTAVTLALATLVAALLLVRLLPTVLTWLQARRFRVLAPAASWIDQQSAAMREGWVDVTRRHQLGRITVLTALIPVTAAATNYLVLRSFNVPVPVVTALVLLVVLQIGTAVVSVPGNVGVFHYLILVTLAAWDVSQPTAVAVAIVLHIVSLGPKVVLGAFCFRGYFRAETR